MLKKREFQFTDYSILNGENVMNRFFAYFSGFPTHHFPDEIAARLKKELPVRNSLVFISAWPSDYSRNDDDAAGMHEMFAEQGMGFERYSVIDDRSESEQALKLITEASCIFLMGGNATKQIRLICGKGIRDTIVSCSAATLGVSAGSMNMGKTTVDIWESLVPYEGLGFADITVIGHFSYEAEERLDLMKLVSMNRPVCAMADESAIFIRNGQVTCAGEIHWIDKGIITEFSSNLIQVHEEQNR
jgi:peptidase E